MSSTTSSKSTTPFSDNPCRCWKLPHMTSAYRPRNAGHDNPRRALLRQLLPDYLRRCLHVQIGGRSYGAFVLSMVKQRLLDSVHKPA